MTYHDVILPVGTYHERHDQGMRVRCIDCLSNLRVDPFRCRSCKIKHDRRLNVKPLDG